MNGVNNPTKLGVIGAGGVGSATAYAAMVRGSADETSCTTSTASAHTLKHWTSHTAQCSHTKQP